MKFDEVPTTHLKLFTTYHYGVNVGVHLQLDEDHTLWYLINNGASAAHMQVTVSMDIKANTWYNIAIVMKNKIASIYINGVLGNSNDLSAYTFQLLIKLIH